MWKVVAADMPLGLNVGDGKDATGQARWEAVANGNNGAPADRELEFAELLRHLKRQKVRNVVWLTADVHYCAAHYYDPEKAAYKDFDGFWEFVSARSTPAALAPTPWTTHSARRWFSTKPHPLVKPTCRPSRACSSLAR